MPQRARTPSRMRISVGRCCVLSGSESWAPQCIGTSARRSGHEKIRPAADNRRAKPQVYSSAGSSIAPAETFPWQRTATHNLLIIQIDNHRAYLVGLDRQSRQTSLRIGALTSSNVNDIYIGNSA